MKKILILTIVLSLIFSINIFAEEIPDGEYDVKVSLMHAYEEKASMGNNALIPDAKLYINNGNARLKIRFIPLETMGFKGYLGELKVENKTVSVLSEYDIFDEYNDPDTGIDEKLKGLKYPKDLEFDIDINEEIINCSVYVPVMQEMGVGVQKARIKVSIPDELFSKENNETINSDNKEEPDENTSNEDNKYYTVNVNLWHAYEDRESMGNKAMKGNANILLKDGKMTLYISSDKMTVSNITASLINLYYDDGEKYNKADAFSYNMEIEGYNRKRPEVFMIPLRNKDEYLNVMVDPKVEPMGDDPIKARLKIDFNSLKEIKEEDATLINKAKNGVKKPAFNKDEPIYEIDKGIQFKSTSGLFDKEFSFFANKLRGEEFNKIKEKFDSLATVDAYKFEALGPISSIPYDAKTPINSLREVYQPNGEFEILIPIKGDMKDFKVYAVDDEVVELNHTIEDGMISFKHNKLVPIAVVKENKNKVVNNNKTSSNSSLDKVNSNTSNSSNDNLPNAFNINSYKIEEKGGVIFLSLAIIIIILAVSIYFTIRYYKILLKEIRYLNELKIDNLYKKTPKDMEVKK